MKLQQHQQKHIEVWQSSGMSQAAYCREQRLNAKTFGNWLRAYRSGCAVNQPATLVPVTIARQSTCGEINQGMEQPVDSLRTNTALKDHADSHVP